MSLQLNVPAGDKDEAQSKGAQWDPNLKIWYLPDEYYDRLMEVDKWIPAKDTAIILSDEITIAHTQRDCWKCNHPNKIIAIGCNSFYEKDINERDEPVWLEQDFFTLFHQVSAMSENLKSFLSDYHPEYHPAHTANNDSTYWGNHCAVCKNIQGDWFLFDEAGSAFNPDTPEAAAQITLKTFRLKYAPQLDAGYSYGDHLRMIKEFAAQ